VALGFLGLAVVVSLVAPMMVSAQEPQLLVPVTHPMAAFLESRAVAASKGATAEFNKMEWVAFDPSKMKLYISMSDVTKAMSDGKGDINVEENRCGIVYQADVTADYNITALKPAIVGGPFNKEAKPDKCDVNNIANPDSLWVDPFGNLWIGEDTSNHQNNALWRWDGKNLLRFATLPIGAECTGVMVTKAGDLFFTVQHPSAMSQYPFNRGTVVAITGFKANDPFEPVALPEGDDKYTLKLAAGEYQVIARVGEPIKNDIYAQRFGQVNTLAGDLQFVCNHPDANIFLATNQAGTEGYLVTNYECRPGTISKVYLRKEGNSWNVLEGENVNFDAVRGTWNNCGSSLTPWNTVLSGEEYEPVALTDTWKDNVSSMTAYLGQQANPYDYGWLVEIAPDPTGEDSAALVTKHYSLGRFSHEMGFVMPDGKTIIHGDDGANVVLFKTVADEAGDLSANTIYAAKVTQQSDGSFNIEWIELGHATDDEIAEAIAAMQLS